jgi:hypothetical protein
MGRMFIVKRCLVAVTYVMYKNGWRRTCIHVNFGHFQCHCSANCKHEHKHPFEHPKRIKLGTDVHQAMCKRCTVVLERTGHVRAWNETKSTRMTAIQ